MTSFLEVLCQFSTVEFGARRFATMQGMMSEVFLESKKLKPRESQNVYKVIQKEAFVSFGRASWALVDSWTPKK